MKSLSVYLVACATASACAVGSSRPPGFAAPDAGVATDGQRPASSRDGGMPPAPADDGGTAWPPPDGAVGRDASLPPSMARRDAGTAMDSGPAGMDAAVDAVTPAVDAGPPEPPLEVPAGDHVVASADFMPTTGVDGYDISERFRVGWRFEVPAGETWQIDGVGFHNRDGAGSVFGALVALDGGDDLPDSPDLSTPDVLAVNTGPLAGRGHVVVPMDRSLTSGWYAIIFGTEAFGASAMGEYVGPSNGHVPIAGQQPPFTILQTTGATFVQRPGARFFLFVRD